MKKVLSIILFLVFALFALTLNLKNPDAVTLRYYFDIEREVDLFVVLLVPFVVGMLLGILLMSFSVVRTKMQVGKTKRELAKVEKEVQNLRAAAIAEPVKDEV
ncbi:MAG: LapA family protein [Arenicella sp.]|nr:LapA family protein [Arenicella sp.]